jgi:hypothetical protein
MKKNVLVLLSLIAIGNFAFTATAKQTGLKKKNLFLEQKTPKNLFTSKFRSTAKMELDSVITDSTKSYYTYNSKGQCTNELVYSLDSAGWTGKNTYYKINSVGYPDSAEVSTKSGSLLIPQAIYTYTYDSNGKVTSVITDSTSDGINYVHAEKEVFQNDAYGNDTVETAYEWSGSAWVQTGVYKTVYTYNAAGMMESYVYYNNTGAGVWYATSKGVITYDSDNNMTQWIYSSPEYYPSSTSSTPDGWVPSIKCVTTGINTTYTVAQTSLPWSSNPYAKNLITQLSYFSYDTTSINWNAAYTENYYYNQSASGIQQVQKANGSIVYNSNSASLKISQVEGKATLAIYTVAGGKVAEKNFETSTELNISGLSAGVYVVDVQTSNGNLVEKIIK